MKTPSHCKKKPHNEGFTLLEMVISLGLIAMLFGVIYRIAHSSVLLNQIVVDKQNKTMVHNSFFNLLRNHFEQMPGSAVLRLQSYKSDKQALFSLIFQDVPTSFKLGESPITPEAVELVSIEQKNGFVDIILKFYEEKVFPNNATIRNEDVKPVAEIVLLKDISMCRCEVIDGSTMEAQTYWDNNTVLPLQVKFYCRFEPETEIVQQTFWIVPKQNPAIFFQQLSKQISVAPAL